MISLLNGLWEPLDLYCERISSGFLAEPLNFFSNLAFLVLAGRLYFVRKNTCTHEISLRKRLGWLISVAVCVGVGSGLFHSLPNRLTQTLDVIPIAAFVGLSLLYYFQTLRATVASTRKPLIACLSTLMAAPLLAWAAGLTPYLAHGEFYLGIVPAILILAFYEPSPPKKRILHFAALSFAFALTARTLDLMICPLFPSGTHFIWHFSTASVAYLMASLEFQGRKISASS